VATATLLVAINCGSDAPLEKPPSPVTQCLDRSGTVEARDPITRPLRVHPGNPRYFMDAAGKPVLLVGSHNWQNLQLRNDGSRPTPEFAEYLDCLDVWRHNFIRLWFWEDARNEPLPWARIGPGNAPDGEPRFDLDHFDDAFFQRLRQRIEAARARGIYVAVMLFQGWSVEGKSAGREVWNRHPFHALNNVNGIDGDANGDGQGEEVHTLGHPEIIAIQEAYVRRVVQMLNDLDNVLYEISNESHRESGAWQRHMVTLIRQVEDGMPRRHPVGLTVAWPSGVNENLLQGPAEWISPNERHPAGFDYRHDPPPAAGTKVVVVDTDHLAGTPEPEWVWKTFFRGMHPIFMDPLDTTQRSEEIRTAMGNASRIAEMVDLASMVPSVTFASSRYALVDTLDRQFLVYGPTGVVTLSLDGVPGSRSARWIDARTGVSHEAAAIAGGQSRTVTAPFTGPGILLLGQPR